MNKMTLKMLITVCYELDTELGDRISEALKSRVKTNIGSGYTIRNAFLWPITEVGYWSYWNDKVNEYLQGSELLGVTQ